MVWTVDSMREVLQRNDDQVGRALVKLYECQTASEQTSKTTQEHNGKGFNALDAEILSSFAEQYKKSGKLSTKQLVLARKRLTKYYKQLVTIANGQI